MPTPVEVAVAWYCICPCKAAISLALFRRSSVGGRVRPLARPWLFFLALLTRRPVVRLPAAVRPNEGEMKPLLLSRVAPLSLLVVVLLLRLPLSASRFDSAQFGSN